jgi:hypothetical protein
MEPMYMLKATREHSEFHKACVGTLSPQWMWHAMLAQMLTLSFFKLLQRTIHELSFE